MKKLNFYHLNRKIPNGAIYVGRGNRHLGLPHSKFANPFKLRDYNNNREEVLEQYRIWLVKQIYNQEITIEDILSLDGHDLICYCAPLACHIDIIIETIYKLKDKSNTEFRFTWSIKEGYQVNTKGDRRFSAFNAILENGNSIEYEYQVNVKGYPSIEEGKGKKPLTRVDLFTEYLKLWRNWAKRNKELMDFLYNRVLVHGRMLGDFYANTPVNQAHALSIILNEKYLGYKRVIVAGSRDYVDYEFLKNTLDQLPVPISTIVCGEARGPDRLGRQYGEERGIVVESYPADWEKHPRAAGHIRNAEMANNADVLVAFWDAKSPGTKSMIDLAKQKKLQLFIILVDTPKIVDMLE